MSFAIAQPVAPISADLVAAEHPVTAAIGDPAELLVIMVRERARMVMDVADRNARQALHPGLEDRPDRLRSGHSRRAARSRAAPITPGDQSVLARWFLKTAALTSSQNYRLMLPAAFRHSAAEDPHPDVQVFLGRRALDGGKIEFGQQAGVAFGFAPTDRQAEFRALMAKGYACAIGVNDVLGIVAYAPPGGWAVPSAESARIWPTTGSPARPELPLIEKLFEAVWLQGSLPWAP